MSLHILHTADWHLGQVFYGYDREAEQDGFLSWLLDYMAGHLTDVLLIAGDVFDVANPSAAAQKRFFRFIREAHDRLPTLRIIVTAGNHDSAGRLEAPAPLLEELNTVISGYIRRNEEGEIDPSSVLVPLEDKTGRRRAWCMAVPYLRQGDYPPPGEDGDTSHKAGIQRLYHWLYDQVCSVSPENEPVIAMGHMHVTGAELSDNDRSERIIMGGLESVSTDAFPSRLSYVALGHIHRAQRIGGLEHIRYAGSPLPMSFSEVNYNHQVVSVVLADDGTCEITAVPVPVMAPLKRIPSRPLPPEEVLERLTLLPDGADVCFPERPYVEIRVLMKEPEPSFRHRVEEALQDKAVRLTSIVPHYPQQEEEEDRAFYSLPELQSLDPLEMLKKSFRMKYGEEMPEILEELFAEVRREVEL